MRCLLLQFICVRLTAFASELCEANTVMFSRLNWLIRFSAVAEHNEHIYEGQTQIYTSIILNACLIKLKKMATIVFSACLIRNICSKHSPVNQLLNLLTKESINQSIIWYSAWYQGKNMCTSYCSKQSRSTNNSHTHTQIAATALKHLSKLFFELSLVPPLCTFFIQIATLSPNTLYNYFF